MQKIIPILVIVLANFIMKAQQDTAAWPDEQLLAPLIDRIESMDEGAQVLPDDWIEETMAADDNAFDLNHLSWATAVTLLHFTDYQYYQLQLYIEEYGEMVSIYELLAVEGFKEEDFRRLKPCVKVVPTQKRLYFFRNFFKHCRNNLWVRYGRTLEMAAGYDTSRVSHYAGSPMQLCFRYSFNTQDRLFVKFAGRKEAGGQFFRGGRRQGGGFYSGSVCLKDMGVLKTLALGDFRLNLGQGLVAGSSMLSGRGFGIDGLRKFQTAVRAVAPANESDFLRGGAVVVGNAAFKGTAFAAVRTGGKGNAFGADLLYQHPLFKIGMRAVGTAHGKPPDVVQLYQTYSREKVRSFNFGVDYQAIVRKQLLFGELACNETGRIGLLQGAVLNLAPMARLAVLVRYYDKRYAAPLGRAFGTLSANSGETGCFLSGEFILGQNMALDVYFDYYRLLWLSYRKDAPASGTDAGASLKCQIGRYSSLNVSYWFKLKEENASADEAASRAVHYRALREQYRHKFRLAVTSRPWPWCSAKTQFDFVLNRSPGGGQNAAGGALTPALPEWNKGLLLFQDLAFDFPRAGLSLRLRLACFDTDRYAERLYAYEHDVYYAFTINSYYGKGFRAYLVLRYRYEWFSVWLRLARTHYLDRRSVGSGLNQIDAPHKTDLRLQVMFSF